MKPGLDRIPVYVKDGAIIPMMEPKLHAPKAGEKINLEIRHYGMAESSYRLYDDDGETFNYENGAYSWRSVTVSRTPEGKLKGNIGRANVVISDMAENAPEMDAKEGQLLYVRTDVTKYGLTFKLIFFPFTFAYFLFA